MVTSLKSPTQTTNSQSSQHHVSINNHTLNNNNNNANIKNSLPSSEFLQPQQHQLQIQINGGDVAISKQQQQRRNSDGVGKLVSPPKGVKASQVTLSAAGPITDL